jgi:hypothetical protein
VNNYALVRPVHLETIKGRKNTFLDEMLDEPIVVEFKNGQIFGGNIDGYETGAFWLYNCKRLDKKANEWKNHGIMIEFEGEEIEDAMPEFLVSDVKNIFAFKSDFDEEISIDDALQFYVDPHHKPLQGIKCNYSEGGNKEHSPECDGRLHEALIYICTNGIMGHPDNEQSRNLNEACNYVRRRLLMYGAKIP